jgi:hypothetical protein
MKLKQARQVFEKISELCYDSENPRLIEVIESLYNDIETADSVTDIISMCDEIVVAINEEDFTSDEEEFVDEIQQLIESMIE